VERAVLNALATAASPPNFPRFTALRASIWPFGNICHRLRSRNGCEATAGLSSRSTDALANGKGLPKQPLHVIAHAVFERKPRPVPERFARVREIGLRKVLIMRVRIIEVFGLKVCAQTFI
jgi:hypothetical protein